MNPKDEMFDVDALNFPELPTEPVTPESVTFKGDEKATETPVTIPETPAKETVDKTEEKPVEVVPKEPVKEEPQVPTKPEIKISDPPSKFEGESDIQFNLRKQIYDAGQAKAQAETPEEKSALAKHIKTLRGELGKQNKSSGVVQTPEAPKVETNESQAQGQSEEELAKAALKKMGFKTAEEMQAEIDQRVQEIVAQNNVQTEHASAINDFYSSHKDIASNPAQRDILEAFVVKNFNITPQSTKQDILVAMDMARAYLFPKVDNRSAKAAESASKRDIVSISSNTQNAPTVTPHDARAAKALEEVGLSMKEMGWD